MRCLLSFMLSFGLVLRSNQLSNKPVPILDRALIGTKKDHNSKWTDSQEGPFDGLFMSTFRKSLARELQMTESSFEPGYAGLIKMIRVLHDSRPNVAEVSASSRRALRNLFPNWPPFAPPGQVGLLFWFGVLFALPFPAFSARLNALVTKFAATWLMGPCVIEDLTGGAHGLGGRGQKLLVKRCRYLEEAGCASICLHTCKLPTQAFFNEDMRVPMRMTPNYETFECAFEFGYSPSEEEEQAARAVPCFAACGSARSDKTRAECSPIGSCSSSSATL